MANFAHVVADSGSLTSAEQAEAALIVELGHTTTPVTLGAAIPGGSDAIFVGHGPSSTQANYTYLRDLALPMVWGVRASNGAVNEVKMASGSAVVASTTSVRIEDDSHPLAGGFAGSVSVLSSSNEQRAVDTTFIPASAAVIAAFSSADPVDTRKVIFGFEAGSVGADAFEFPARRVFCGLVHNAPLAVLTADGKTLVQASLDWAAASGPTFDPVNLVATPSGSTAALSWDASPTPGVADYQVFRRTPPTGADFDPNTDTPVATGVTGTTYDDESLTAADYDTQVFGRIPG